MSKASALLVRRSTWLGLAVVIVALAVVPALARARQHVERRETTRLSIRHSWVGIAPPTKISKAVVAPQHVLVRPAVVRLLETRGVLSPAPVAPAPARHSVFEQSPDPLRGPPSARFS